MVKTIGQLANRKFYCFRIKSCLYLTSLVCCFAQITLSQSARPCFEPGPTIPITSGRLALSPDGRFLAQESRGRILISSIEAGFLTRELEGPKRDIESPLQFSQDSRFLSAAGDGVVHVWEASTGKFLHELNGIYGRVRDISFSPDGKFITAVGSQKRYIFRPEPDARVRVWETTTGRLVPHASPIWIPQHGVSIFNRSAFSPDGKLLFAAFNGQYGFWDPLTGGRITELVDPEVKPHDKPITYSGGIIGEMKFSPNGKYLATTGFYGDFLRIWDVPSGKLRAKIEAFASVIAFSPDSTLLAFDKGKELYIWNIEHAKEIKRLERHTKLMESISFSADGHFVASSDLKQTIIWDTTTWAATASISDARLSWFTTGRVLATAGPGRFFRLWDVNCN